ncbi:hypothetical protein Q4485_15555 [Granulosicoccaceae sp. 1_MG-2023]|nr:hypothetical protein [Granulosicoccaceae sp. 1_MG-2023]
MPLIPILLFSALLGVLPIALAWVADELLPLKTQASRIAMAAAIIVSGYAIQHYLLK